jgi:hypothetical protein
MLVIRDQTLLSTCQFCLLFVILKQGGNCRVKKIGSKINSELEAVFDALRFIGLVERNEPATLRGTDGPRVFELLFWCRTRHQVTTTDETPTSNKPNQDVLVVRQLQALPSNVFAVRWYNLKYYYYGSHGIEDFTGQKHSHPPIKNWCHSLDRSAHKLVVSQLFQ